MNPKRQPSSNHGAPGPRGAPQEPPEDADDVTDSPSRRTLRPTTDPVPGNPYFRPPKGPPPTTELSAMRPLSDAVITPYRPAENWPDSPAMEPVVEDSALNEAINTKRLPNPARAEALMAEMERIVASIPEAGGSNTEVRRVLPQGKVLEEPGLLLHDGDIEPLRERLSRGLLASLWATMQERVEALLRASAPVPYDHHYYSLHSVGPGASILESPTLLEAALVARVTGRRDATEWATVALVQKCRQNEGRFLDTAGDAPDAAPGFGCVTALRDVSLAADLLRPMLEPAARGEVTRVLADNAVRLAAYINTPDAGVPPSLSEQGAMALGLCGLPLMSDEGWYAQARRWVDTAEQRAQQLLKNRVSDNGRPAASDLAGLTELLRYLLPFAEAFRRFYGDDMLMGEGGNLSQLPRWLAHQFGFGRVGMFAGGRLKVDDVRGATPVLARLADTYRDGVAQWMLQQVSVAEAAIRASVTGRVSSQIKLALPARPGLDAVLTCVFLDPDLRAQSPGMAMAPGARLSDTRAVVRSDWEPSGSIVTLQAETGALPYVQLASSGVNVRLLSDRAVFEGMGGNKVFGRVRDYVELGGAAYINGEFKGSEGSLAHRHLVYLRSEQTVLLFDRFDIGDGRSSRRVGLRIAGAEECRRLDRGTLAVAASDGSGREARFIFYSNGFSDGVEDSADGAQPGLSVEFLRGRGDLASIVSFGRAEQMADVRRINAEERGRVYRATMGEGAVLFNGWQGGMPQQCGWIWTDALLAFVDRRDDYPGRYVAIKATSVLSYDMHEGIHLGFGASHPEDPDKPVEFSLCASGPQAVIFLTTRAHVRLAFPGLKRVLVDGNPAAMEGESRIFELTEPLEPGRHLIEFEHESPGPESAIVTPREDQFVGGEFSLHASIGDPIGVDTARLLIDGSYWGEQLRGPPWVWKVNGRQLAEGAHEAQIEATDVLQRARRSAIRRFRVDNTPPQVELKAPTDGKKARGYVLFSAVAQDLNGVERVQFCLNGRKLGDPVTAPPYAREFDTSAVPDGVYTVTALAFDAAGNVGQSPGARVTLANNAPPPQVVKLKIIPPVLAVHPLQMVPLKLIALDDEDNERPARVQWRRLKGQGVVDRDNLFTAPGTEGPCVLEAQVVGTTVRARLHVVVSKM
jgi:hypothetical protein